MDAGLDWDFSSAQETILAEVARRLSVIHPRLVMLFGSRATGRARPDSDYDVLVVVDFAGPGSRSAPVRRLLRGLGVPFDLIVYTPEEWSAWRAHPQSLA